MKNNNVEETESAGFERKRVDENAAVERRERAEEIAVSARFERTL